MSGHHHSNDPSLTQNQGNTLGDRPCVRQSRNYREGVSGNAMKDIMGQGELKWDTTQTQGCYQGGSVYDHDTYDNRARKGNFDNNTHYNNQQQQQQHQQRPPQQQQQQYQQQQPQTQQYENIYANQNQNNNNNNQYQGQDQYQSQNQNQGRNNNNNNYRSSPAAPVPTDGATSASTGKGFRPGAGYANKQTFNIFGGN